MKTLLSMVILLAAHWSFASKDEFVPEGTIFKLKDGLTVRPGSREITEQMGRWSCTMTLAKVKKPESIAANSDLIVDDSYEDYDSGYEDGCSLKTYDNTMLRPSLKCSKAFAWEEGEVKIEFKKSLVKKIFCQYEAYRYFDESEKDEAPLMVPSLLEKIFGNKFTIIIGKTMSGFDHD